MMPIACEGKKRWNGNRKPVTLVATVLQIKTAVQPLSGFELSSPNKTTKPAKIPIRLNKTCTKVNIVMPKIMREPPFEQKWCSGYRGNATIHVSPLACNLLRRIESLTEKPVRVAE